MTVDGWGSVLERHNDLLAAADQLPQLSATVVELADAVSDPTIGVDVLSEITLRDPMVSARLLREANSAAHSTRQGIESVERAIVQLGGARLLAIALNGHVQESLGRALPAYDLPAGALERHATATAFAAEACSRMATAPVGREVMAAAILHDIGKPLISPLLDVQQARQLLQADPSAVTMERELLDVDHGEVAAYVLEAWKLPDSIVRAVRDHHDAAGSSGAQAVLVADWVAHLVLEDQPSTPDMTDVDSAIADLGLDGRVDDLVAAVRKSLDRAQPQ